MATKLQTLINTVESLTVEVCKLIDAGASSEVVEAARAKRDAVKASIHSRADGRTYDRGHH